MKTVNIEEALGLFYPVTLEEIENVRLMNRFDTKYILSVRKVPEILNRMEGCYKILEINKNRSFTYYTTYLDTNDYLFYNQHITGKLERNKVRYRRYGITGVTFLEVKKRTNTNRTIKWRIEYEPASLGECDDKAYEFIGSYVAVKPLHLKPSLNSNFKRITLVGSNINERITIDYDITFSGIEGNSLKLPFVAILEVKKEGYAGRSPVATMLKDYSVYPAGFSKYCIGAAIINDPPKKNMLKEKFLMLNKIENEFNRHLNA
jgi:hypothetical protein